LLTSASFLDTMNEGNSCAVPASAIHACRITSRSQSNIPATTRQASRSNASSAAAMLIARAADSEITLSGAGVRRVGTGGAV
jgi:hypothetical protein